MFKSILLTCVLLTVSPTSADTILQKIIDHNGILHGCNFDYEFASRDKDLLIGLWGTDAQVNGQLPPCLLKEEGLESIK